MQGPYEREASGLKEKIAIQCSVAKEGQGFPMFCSWISYSKLCTCSITFYITKCSHRKLFTSKPIMPKNVHYLFRSNVFYTTVFPEHVLRQVLYAKLFAKLGAKGVLTIMVQNCSLMFAHHDISKQQNLNTKTCPKTWDLLTPVLTDFDICTTIN